MWELFIFLSGAASGVGATVVYLIVFGKDDEDE